ncbi:hypothetical protein SAMN02927924_01401 [Sphingobium faniae]|nr:hypothetical protein SAMN02927924_01401 [Sphingobium faniae]
MVDTNDKAQVAQDFLASIQGVPGLTVYTPGTHGLRNWGASCYWPKGDVVRDISCHGNGDTLEAAIADMFVQVEKAKEQQKVLKTAAEVKNAVIALIKEHDAAPASFRDAVDALPVKG